MFKKVLALTLAVVMLLMPMTASAVTWNTIVSNLGSSNKYVSGDTTATKDGDTITVTGGTVEFGYGNAIEDGGTYIFRDVGVDGKVFVWAWDEGDNISLEFDKDSEFLSDEGIFLSATLDNVITLKNDTEIKSGAGEYTLGIYCSDDAKVSVVGSGKIDNALESRAVSIVIETEGALTPEQAAAVASSKVSIQETQIDGKIRCYVDLYDENGKHIGRGVIDSSEILVEESEKEEDDDEEEEPEPEPDPIELQRQAEGIGGVTTSPVWNWQGYLGHSSKPMWIYVNGEKVLMRQRLFWLGDSTKNHTCRINVAEPDPASIELRVGLDMLRTAQRAEISVISILDKDSNPIAQFAVSDLLGAFEQYGLEEGELLCVSADPDAEVMKVTLDGEYLPLEEAEEENAAA